MHNLNLVLIAITLARVLATNSPQDCKCVPNNPCWPSTEDFDALNRTVSGHLIQGIPPASVCYPSQPNYNTTTCDVVLSSWFSSSFHAADPISIGWPWWAHNSCPPIYANGTSVTGDAEAGAKGCSLGAYPVYAVNATEVRHVEAVVRFARERNIRLNVKSTGHSFYGRSTGFGSISVWTHHMRGIQWHDDFQPESCPLKGTQAAATIAAGERVRDVYEAAAEHDAVIVGGSAQDVGIMGWFSGGGHGPLSSDYGLGVDNVLQAKLITPTGDHLTLNPCLNPDLFWAIRGGGGSTFGVITEVTMRAHPSPRVSRHTFALALANPKNETGYWDIVAYILSELPRLKEAGMQGYSFLVPPISGIDLPIYNRFASFPTWTWIWGFNMYDKPNGTIEELFAPIAEKLNPENGSTIVYTSSIQHYPDFFTAWNTYTDDEPVAEVGLTLSSRLIPAAPLLRDQQHLAHVLRNISASADGLYYPILQPTMIANNRTGLNDEVSVTPAWRDAVLHFIVGEGYLDSETFEEAKPVIERVTYERTAALKGLAPESGAYFNEGDAFDPNWQYTFWGKNYPRLRHIKKMVDPDGLLWCLSCVGSEEWEQVGSGRLCRVPWARQEE